MSKRRMIAASVLVFVGLIVGACTDAPTNSVDPSFKPGMGGGGGGMDGGGGGDKCGTKGKSTPMTVTFSGGGITGDGSDDYADSECDVIATLFGFLLDARDSRGITIPGFGTVAAQIRSGAVDLETMEENGAPTNEVVFSVIWPDSDGGSNILAYGSGRCDSEGEKLGDRLYTVQDASGTTWTVQSQDPVTGDPLRPVLCNLNNGVYTDPVPADIGLDMVFTTN